MSRTVRPQNRRSDLVTRCAGWRSPCRPCGAASRGRSPSFHVLFCVASAGGVDQLTKPRDARFTAGAGAVARALAETLPVRLSTPVQTVRHTTSVCRPDSLVVRPAQEVHALQGLLLLMRSTSRFMIYCDMTSAKSLLVGERVVAPLPCRVRTGDHAPAPIHRHR